jgi:molybdopterin/thiamine biosynthesis adenylyltransferase
MRSFKVIGTGGVGTALLPFLCRYLNFEAQGSRVVLVDGDSFEPKNSARQDFGRMGNKAQVKAGELAGKFTQISFRARAEVVTEQNIASIIEKGDTIFLGVDNHKTRKLVSDHCQTLSDITLISGGNELTDGNVQAFVKKDGKELTLPITEFHPEIESPVDKNPGEMSCGERAEQPSSRQIIFTNMIVASWMLAAFWLVEQNEVGRLGEYYFDILEGAVSRIQRKKGD